MSTTILIRRIKELEQQKPTDENIIIVRMWTPDGKDGPTEGRRIHIKASNRGEL